jgi:hypothetical protein
MSEPSVSRVLEKLYEARNWMPWLSRFVKLTSSPLYQESPADSISKSESGGTPRMGALNGIFANVFVDTPRIGSFMDAGKA